MTKRKRNAATTAAALNHFICDCPLVKALRTDSNVNQKEEDVAIVINGLFQRAHPMQYPYCGQSLTNGRWHLLCVYALAPVISKTVVTMHTK